MAGEFPWSNLLDLNGAELGSHDRRTLETLGGQVGTLGVIFRMGQNRIQPVMLTLLVHKLVNSENWLRLNAEVKGDAYESLLERNAQDVRTAAIDTCMDFPLLRT